MVILQYEVDIEKTSITHIQYTADIVPAIIGPVVRVSPGEVSFTDANAWKDIYGHKSGPHKPSENTANGATSLINAPDLDHTRMRRIFSPAFSERALRQQEPLFLKYVNLLAEKLSEGIQEDPNRKFDMVKMCAYIPAILRILFDHLYGLPE